MKFQLYRDSFPGMLPVGWEVYSETLEIGLWTYRPWSWRRPWRRPRWEHVWLV